MLSQLEKLCTTDGVAGYEDHVRSVIAEMCRPYADEMHVDIIGDLIVKKRGRKKNAPKLMIAAHMDEVGFLVTKIEADGSLRVEECGGLDPHVTQACLVRIGDNGICGVIGSKPEHLLSEEERKKVSNITELYIDIAVESKEEAEKLVEIGDQAVMQSDFLRFGTDGKYIKAKALDDRLGCAMMVRLLQEDLPLDIDFVFTVQEETGLRGATVSAKALQPDIALILEGTVCSDIPSVPVADRATRIGRGAVLSCMDSLSIYDRKLFEKCRQIATNAGLPWQIKNAGNGGTDAGAIQTVCKGVRVVGIATPVRSIHAASSVVSIEDIENTYQLIKLFLEAIAEEENDAAV